MPMITPEEFEKYNIPPVKPCKECGVLPILREPRYDEMTVWDFRNGCCDWLACCPKCGKLSGFHWKKEDAIYDWNSEN